MRDDWTVQLAAVSAELLKRWSLIVWLAAMLTSP
jgi:hypothetical protein